MPEKLFEVSYTADGIYEINREHDRVKAEGMRFAADKIMHMYRGFSVLIELLEKIRYGCLVRWLLSYVP